MIQQFIPSYRARVFLLIFDKNKLKLNKKLNIYSKKLLNQEKQYLNDKQQDDLVKTILRSRKLDFNTKVIQQTRKLFNEDLKKKFKQMDTLRINYYKKPRKHNFELFNFKKSTKFGYHSFQTTGEQYKLLDYIDDNGKINKKWKILKLFRQQFKIRWTRNLISPNNTITISYDNDWYISFNQKLEIKNNNNKNKKIKRIGMNTNLNCLALSDSHKIKFNLKDKNFFKK